MARNSSLTSTYDELPVLFRIIIQFVFGALVGGIYRIARYFETGNIVTLVAGIAATFTLVGNVIAWVVDLISLFFNGNYTYFVD